MDDLGSASDVAKVLQAVLHDTDGWTVGPVTVTSWDLELRFTIDGDSTLFGLKVLKPASGGLQPWLYGRPQSVEKWAQMLRIWMDEEIHTNAQEWGLIHKEGGVSYFLIGPDGFQKRSAFRNQPGRAGY